MSALWRPVPKKVCSSSILPSPVAPLISICSSNSNILSGHINKCHPNENPLVFSTPSRRKGTSSASRAATSKHACADPFFLANNGSALSQSTASSNPLYADHQFTFPPPQVPAIPYDYSVRYRAQAYILAHMGVIPPERPPPLPAIYQKSQAPHDPTTAARYSQSFPLNNDHQDYPLSPSPNGVGYGYNIDNKVRFIYISFPYSLIDLQPAVRVPEQRPGLFRKRVQPSLSIDVQS